MDILIQAFGIFINDFPYFVLAMTLMWDHLRRSRRHTFFVMFGMTALHAASILSISSIFPQSTVDTIKLPHEIAFMAIYLTAFIWSVKIKLTRILFMGFFIKYFADVITTTAGYFERSFFVDTHSSFGLYFNLCHLTLLLITFPMMYLFITKSMRKIFLVESPIWRYLWLAPAAFYVLNMLYSRLNKTIIYDGDYVVNGAVLFGVSLLVYALILETLRTTQEKLLKEENERRLAADNAALDNLNRQKTEFLQDMNHELRTPLAVIATGITYAKTRCDTQEACEALEIAHEEVLRVGRILDGMSQMSEMKEVAENRRRLNLAALLRESAETFRLRLEAQGTEICLNLEEELPDVFVERDKFARIIGNLLSNAAEYARGGRVTVSAALDHPFISVSVADTGEGVASEIFPAMFERGVSGRDGTGYGLYISKSIVEAHGGGISAESAPGKGCTVTFTVPVYGGQEEGHTA